MTPEDHYRNKVLMESMDTERFRYLHDRLKFTRQYMYNSLQVGGGFGSFQEVGKAYGVSQSEWSWAALLADFDNDGWVDFFVVNGFLFKQEYERNRLYRNLQGTGFEDITTESGLENFLHTTSYTYLDYDVDGDLDLVIAPNFGPVFVYENQEQQHQSIAIELNDFQGNFYGINAKVTIHYGDGKHQMKEVLASGGFRSFDHPALYFGLGKNELVTKIEVDWTSGEKTTLEGEFSSGHLYRIRRKSRVTF